MVSRHGGHLDLTGICGAAAGTHLVSAGAMATASRSCQVFDRLKEHNLIELLLFVYLLVEV